MDHPESPDSSENEDIEESSDITQATLDRIEARMRLQRVRTDQETRDILSRIRIGNSP